MCFTTLTPLGNTHIHTHGGVPVCLFVGSCFCHFIHPATHTHVLQFIVRLYLLLPAAVYLCVVGWHQCDEIHYSHPITHRYTDAGLFVGLCCCHFTHPVTEAPTHTNPALPQPCQAAAHADLHVSARLRHLHTSHFAIYTPTRLSHPT